MQQEDDLRGLSKTMDFMRGVSILFTLLNIYWFCYPVMYEWNFTLSFLDKILLSFQKNTGLFTNIFITKLFAFLFLGLSCLGTKAVKSEKISWGMITALLVSGVLFYFGSPLLMRLSVPDGMVAGYYIAATAIGYLCMLIGAVFMARILKNSMMKDVFNLENESFMQETRLIENEYSVNIPTRFVYNKKIHKGWLNIVNPQRSSAIIGLPGSGKTFALINNFIKQMIEKGYTMYIYDYKYPDLTQVAYNHLLKHNDAYRIKPTFYVINFDDPRRSHRCNPINPKGMSDIADAYEASYTIMLNLNRTWVQKQGDFFVESPIILFTAVIWFLKLYKGGKYCTFPHAVELLNREYSKLFPILSSYDALENYMSNFMDAWESDAQEQLQVRP